MGLVDSQLVNLIQNGLISSEVASMMSINSQVVKTSPMHDLLLPHNERLQEILESYVADKLLLGQAYMLLRSLCPEDSSESLLRVLCHRLHPDEVTQLSLSEGKVEVLFEGNRRPHGWYNFFSENRKDYSNEGP